MEATHLRAPLVADDDVLHLRKLVQEHVQATHRPALQVRGVEVLREDHGEVPGGQLNVDRE